MKQKSVLILSVLALLAGGYLILGNESTPYDVGTTSSFTATRAVVQAAGVASNGAVTKSALAAHSTDKDCWVAISGKVYDLSAFSALHPGGSREITRACGTDATSEYVRERGHSREDAVSELSQRYVGAYSG